MRRAARRVLAAGLLKGGGAEADGRGGSTSCCSGAVHVRRFCMLRCSPPGSGYSPGAVHAHPSRAGAGDARRVGGRGGERTVGLRHEALGTGLLPPHHIAQPERDAPVERVALCDLSCARGGRGTVSPPSPPAPPPPATASARSAKKLQRLV